MVSPTDDSLVTEVTQALVYPYYSGCVTGYYSVSESIAVTHLELPVPAVIFLSLQSTIIEYTVVSSQFEKMIRDDSFRN